MSDVSDPGDRPVGAGADADAAERERIVDLLAAIDRALASADDVHRMALGLRCERDALVARLRWVCGGSIH